MRRTLSRALLLTAVFAGVVGLAACGKSSNTNTGNHANVNLQPNPGLILGISPKVGPAAGGTEVTITGNNFIGTPQVLFGTAAGTNVKVVNDKKITVTSPAGTKGAKVNVVLKSGDGPTSTLQGGFTYQ